MIAMLWVALLALGSQSTPACPAFESIAPALKIEQGGVGMGQTSPGSMIRLNDRALKPSAQGEYVFAVARDATAPLTLTITPACGPAQVYTITVVPRDFPVERVNGVPPATANPNPQLAKRIEMEQAQVADARKRDDDRQGYRVEFLWPVKGRISGRFGSSRSYNGTPGAAHSGMDIAAASGTPIRAPAPGVVTFANPSLYLTGGTVVLDHGQGVSSNFLHMSRIDVKVGDVIKQGQIVGAVGATGRATGPHLHWGMNWFETRLDPLLMIHDQD